MLKLKLQYFGHMMVRVDSLEKTLMVGKIEGRRRRGRKRMRWLDGITGSLEKTLMVGKIEGRRRRGRQRMRWLDGITGSLDTSFGKAQRVKDREACLVCCSSWGCQESDTT